MQKGIEVKVGLSKAAKLTGKDPSTLTRAVQSGKLSCHVDSESSRTFDIAELERVYGPLKHQDENSANAEIVQSTNTHAQMEELREREFLAIKEQIRLLERQLEDVRSDRDKWQAQAAQITRLLTDQRSVSSREDEPRPRPTLLARLRTALRS